jgi:TonB family protein
MNKLIVSTIVAVAIAGSASAEHVAPSTKMSVSVKGPEVIKLEKPVYPPLAQMAKAEGKVIVLVRVDRTGKAQEAFVASTTNPMFNKAAVDAAMKSIFSTAITANGSTDTWVRIPYSFKTKR